MICANLPDIDFLPGLMLGLPNLYHHGISHSLGLAILLALIAGIYVRWRERRHSKKQWAKRRAPLRIFGIVFALYFGHALLDCLIVDTSPPFGVQLLWPLTSRYTISPVLIFPSVHKASTSGAFLGSLIHIGNLKLIAVELLYFVPLVIVTHLFIRRGRGRNRDPSPGGESYDRSASRG
jgi:hypothetical protein